MIDWWIQGLRWWHWSPPLCLLPSPWFSFFRSAYCQLMFIFTHSGCCSVTKSCLTLCNPMDCSMPGFPVLHYLMSFESVMPSNHLILFVPLFSCPQSFPASRSFSMSRLFTSEGQSIGASASVLPTNTHDWFALGWTGWISLLSKGLSRVFSNTTVQKCQFFDAPPSLWSVSHISTWPLLALLKPGNLAHGDPVCPWVQACHLVRSGPLPTWLKLLKELGGSPTESSRTEGWPGRGTVAGLGAGCLEETNNNSLKIVTSVFNSYWCLTSICQELF